VRAASLNPLTPPGFVFRSLPPLILLSRDYIPSKPDGTAWFPFTPSMISLVPEAVVLCHFPKYITQQHGRFLISSPFFFFFREHNSSVHVQNPVDDLSLQLFIVNVFFHPISPGHLRGDEVVLHPSLSFSYLPFFVLSFSPLPGEAPPLRGELFFCGTAHSFRVIWLSCLTFFPVVERALSIFPPRRLF